MAQIENTIQDKTQTRGLGDINDAARVLNVPRTWLYERTRKNTCPLVRCGKYIRFDLERLLEWAKVGCPENWK